MQTTHMLTQRYENAEKDANSMRHTACSKNAPHPPRHVQERDTYIFDARE